MAIISAYKPDDPRFPSAAYQAQAEAYRDIQAVLEGAKAVRRQGAVFLPRYPAEDNAEYDRRVASAPWRAEFADSLRNIASKPFSKPVALTGEPSARIKEFAEDVDTLGNNLHVFARAAFWSGVAFGLHGILAEYPTIKGTLTVQQERAAGVRPSWLHVPAYNILALRTETIEGKTAVTHLRFLHRDTRPDGQFGEKCVEQVRILEPFRWEVWEPDDKNEMRMVDSGTSTMPVVPLALFYTGDRLDAASHVKPPMSDLADMQIELYRAMSREDEILTFGGSPMLKAIGMSKPTDGTKIEVGPKRILFAPSSGDGPTDWAFIQPDAAIIAAQKAHVQSVMDDMRRLGLQPLLPKSGDLTATVGALEAAKAHSAVEAWANALKDALEQALLYTSMWFKEQPTAEVFVHTDFGIELEGGGDMGELLKARMAGEISRLTYWTELQRRSKLSGDFDPDEEDERLKDEKLDDPIALPAPPPGNGAGLPGNGATPPERRQPPEAQE